MPREETIQSLKAVLRDASPDDDTIEVSFDIAELRGQILKTMKQETKEAENFIGDRENVPAVDITKKENALVNRVLQRRLTRLFEAPIDPIMLEHAYLTHSRQKYKERNFNPEMHFVYTGIFPLYTFLIEQNMGSEAEGVLEECVKETGEVKIKFSKEQKERIIGYDKYVPAPFPGAANGSLYPVSAATGIEGHRSISQERLQELVKKFKKVERSRLSVWMLELNSVKTDDMQGDLRELSALFQPVLPNLADRIKSLQNIQVRQDTALKELNGGPGVLKYGYKHSKLRIQVELTDQQYRDCIASPGSPGGKANGRSACVPHAQR